MFPNIHSSIQSCIDEEDGESERAKANLERKKQYDGTWKNEDAGNGKENRTEMQYLL